MTDLLFLLFNLADHFRGSTELDHDGANPDMSDGGVGSGSCGGAGHAYNRGIGSSLVSTGYSREGALYNDPQTGHGGRKCFNISCGVGDAQGYAYDQRQAWSDFYWECSGMAHGDNER